MVGGGMTPILAAGFQNVSESYGVTIPQVALTTGLYMMGLGVGSVIFSPTAIKFGKRPVYLATCFIFLLTAIWCALSPNYASLCVARVIQGIAVSPVECLPSATIAEIFYLHERAYRLGVYTLLLLGGKNLIPLVSAAIIQSLSWHWVFYIVAIVVGFCWILLFFFVPESFWDRTPRPHEPRPRRKSTLQMPFRRPSQLTREHKDEMNRVDSTMPTETGFQSGSISGALAQRRAHDEKHHENHLPNIDSALQAPHQSQHRLSQPPPPPLLTRDTSDYFHFTSNQPDTTNLETGNPSHSTNTTLSPISRINSPLHYTKALRHAPRKTYIQTLQPYSGRLSPDSWLRIALRPAILLAYPAILWSSAIYALSVGWLIILSESVSTIYRSDAYAYRFTAIQTGLIYLSPFIGGILGTAVAGKLSDVIVRFMARRNHGIYEPEFRLVMALPIALATTAGLWGFGWAAEERDAWIVPTVFFGVISFGCCLGSTTAITFAVDSYRQYAGEALVSLNWCKNVFDGLVFSLFFAHWLEADGSKTVFLALGGIQLAVCATTPVLYLYGKRARLWTLRKGMMDRWK